MDEWVSTYICQDEYITNDYPIIYAPEKIERKKIGMNIVVHIY